MKVKELITILLDFNMDKEIVVEYPTDSGNIVGNYCRYNDSKDFEVNEFDHGVIIGVEE